MRSLFSKRMIAEVHNDLLERAQNEFWHFSKKCDFRFSPPPYSPCLLVGRHEGGEAILSAGVATIEHIRVCLAELDVDARAAVVNHL